MTASSPSTGADRLATLHRYDILDTPPEQRFDRITTLAARWLDVPIALVTLLDEDRQWFKSCVGLDQRETSREVAFCAHNIDDEAMLVVEDATQDPRFADNPLVTGEPGIRFYAGAPLVTPDGAILGSLCAIDTVPRSADAMELDLLSTLAQIVVDEMELRRVNSTLRERNEQVQSLTRQLKAVQEANRSQLSRLLHEELKQVLQAARLQTETISEHVDATQAQRLTRVAEHLDDALDLTASLSARFAPPVGNQPLRDTFEWLALQMQEAHDLSVSILGPGAPSTADEGLKTLLYRLVRELLFQIARAPEATGVQVHLIETAGHLRITVEDEHGQYDPEAALQTSPTLARIRDEMTEKGGRIEVHSREGLGSCVRIEVPQPSPAAVEGRPAPR